jgi:phenylacetic acid degradation operon negative regulatory protein
MVDGAGRALSARSIIASTLLGTHPPNLEGRLLVAFAAMFGVRPGTTRVALSRMVDNGEVERSNGTYALIGELLERQIRQDTGLGRAQTPWDGTWETVVVRNGSRATTDRGALRRACRHLGLGELREGVWMRPANLDPTRLPAAQRVVEAQADRLESTAGEGAADIAGRIFDLDGWARTALRLVPAMTECTAQFERGPIAMTLPRGFVVAADVLRQLVADPALPDALQPPGWPAGDLWAAHHDYDTKYRRRLHAFFRSVK